MRLRSRVKYRWVITCLAFALIILPVRYCFERVKPFEKKEFQPAWVRDLKNMKNKIPQSDKTVLFNLEHPVEAMFYNRFTAYSHIPERKVLEELVGRGYDVFIIDRGNVGDSLRSIRGVQVW
jgi:hypothetical protein